MIQPVDEIAAEVYPPNRQDRLAALREVLKSPKRDLSIMNKYFWTWKSSKAN